VGVGPPPDDERPADGRPRHHDLLGTRGRIAVGLVFFVLFSLTFGLRGNVAAGLVGGVLGGILFFLLLRDAEIRRRRRT
jgi:membrane associated rhomboid family serine protease